MIPMRIDEQTGSSLPFHWHEGAEQVFIRIGYEIGKRLLGFARKRLKQQESLGCIAESIEKIMESIT